MFPEGFLPMAVTVVEGPGDRPKCTISVLYVMAGNRVEDAL